METTKYPEDHRVLECLPQYGNTYLSCRYEEDRALTTSDYSNWRLPTIEEIQSIMASGTIELTDKELWSRCSSSGNYINADAIDENNNITSVQKTEVKFVLACRIIN